MSSKIGIHAGKRFTDFVLTEDDGARTICEVLSTPQDASAATVRRGVLRRVLG